NAKAPRAWSTPLEHRCAPCTRPYLGADGSGSPRPHRYVLAVLSRSCWPLSPPVSRRCAPPILRLRARRVKVAKRSRQPRQAKTRAYIVGDDTPLCNPAVSLPPPRGAQRTPPCFGFFRRGGGGRRAACTPVPPRPLSARGRSPTP